MVWNGRAASGRPSHTMFVHIFRVRIEARIVKYWFN